MNIIHTADWHLGQSFYEYDRKAEHACFLQWLEDTVRELGADILLIAGDVFDSPNPSAESQKVYFSFLRRITHENPMLQIIITAGNHDSAARLEAPNPLLEEMNITVRGIVRRDTNGDIDYEHLIVPLNKGGYCLAAPYLRQGDYPDAENYSASVKALYDKLYETALAKTEDGRIFAPIIAMGHLQATGSEISENDRSERTIIGGLECVSPEAFSDGIIYTALGHLHRGQRVSGRENVRYAGAPVPMSFAEKNNKQGVLFIRINDVAPVDSSGLPAKNKYDISIKRIEFENAVELISIPRDAMPLNDVLDEIKKLPEGEITERSPYLEIKVLITEPEPSMRHQIEELLNGKSVRLARIAAVTQQYESNDHAISYETLKTISPIDMALKIYRQQYGDEMPEPMLKLLHKTIREAETDDPHSKIAYK
ncbi:MAG: exonuclease SbcCD subunit D C-terminal domain-containing protein [Tannerella sp.]|jgi:exonuclease SbcD|nr:exonuclease SbcCD subunit D C-terminal domain-containing protein [Tannerella sp.]